jgi:hypothetical protein
VYAARARVARMLGDEGKRVQHRRLGGPSWPFHSNVENR